MTNLPRAPQWWRRVSSPVWYLAVGVLFFVGSLVPALHSHGTVLGGVPTRSFDALAVVAVGLQCFPLVICRRWPVVALTLVSTGFALDQLRGYHSFAGTGLAITVLTLGSRLERHRRATVLVFSAAYVPLAVALDQLAPGKPVEEFVTFYLALALVWAIGAWLRSNRAAETERRRRVADDTRTAERTRIARELHDVVTHHVTAMVVQSEAARYLTAAPERLDETLTGVGDTGRRAITDLRHLLDLLNPDHGTGTSTASVGGLLPLVERSRRAGQPVEFTEKGAPARSTSSADLVAYRVVQEALTNALKYDHGSRTSVQVHHGEREITVAIGTDGSGSPAASPGGSGRGLAGLRERVDALGGDFSADRGPDGGFTVRARIPAEERS
ncbi:sensor histidine kinase [Streptomyces sp. NBC_01506]|uniref:sensor histidine kinase n=1 Tax=Streptomyces sp. NBC_01506 TaxID=2903887 RepID=UPI00386E0176